MPNIKFVNHASVLISDDNTGLLTDPWYEGNILNEGWSLLYENNESDIYEVLNKTTHIWISHEHPDHFSVNFFLKYRELILKRDIKIIFQNTKDKRVVSFLRSKSYHVHELNNSEIFKLDKDFEIQIQKFGFYDSALIINLKGKKIINLNDCIIENETETRGFAKKYGPADILLTQFSYAAWKGGKSNIDWRSNAAREKIDRITEQLNQLSCNELIPFASFNYFSNSENFYMNDKINTPMHVKNIIEARNKNINVTVMKPLEAQDTYNLNQKKDSLLFWKNIYENINVLPKLSYKNLEFNELKLNFENYQKKIFKNNSKIFMLCISLIPWINIFKKINIYLYDLNTTVRYSIFSELQICKENKYDVVMHSRSLNFIFLNDFGYDTLTANGNFETSKEGFAKLTKTLSIGSLNTLGYKFSLSLLFNPSIYLFFFYMLSKVSKNIENPYD